MRYLWLLLPIITLFPLSYVASRIFKWREKWWSFPLASVCMAIYMVLVAISTNKFVELIPEFIELRVKIAIANENQFHIDKKMMEINERLIKIDNKLKNVEYP